MKYILLLMLTLGLFFLGSCSGMSIQENYVQTPAKAMSTGEGRHTYNFHYQGKNYVLVKGGDGRYYAVQDPATAGDPFENAMKRMNQALEGGK